MSIVISGEAIEAAFEATSSDRRKIEESAAILKQVIFKGLETYNMPWPPPSGKVLKGMSPPDPLLQHFVECLLPGGDSRVQVSSSLAYDIMYKVSGGRWMTPKHIMLAVTLWHLTGKAELITLLN